MKKSVVAMAISTTLVLSVLTLGCGEPAPAAFEQQSAAPVTLAATPEEIILGEKEQATRQLISELIETDQQVPDSEYARLQSIVDAREALRQLEAERQEVVMRINAGPVGEVPEDLIVELGRIVEMRQAILARNGLVR